jgi:hypothetical protein
MITINLHVTNLRPAFPPTLDIEYRVDGGQPISLQSTAPGIYPVSLPAPGPYNFEVRTVNAYGVSPWSTVKASDDLSIVNDLLFSQGQQGGAWIPTLSPTMISAETFGTGVQNILDLSPRNNPFSQANSGNRAAWFREPKRGRVNLLTSSVSVASVNGHSVSTANDVITGTINTVTTNQFLRFNFSSDGTSHVYRAMVAKSSTVASVFIRFRDTQNTGDIYATTTLTIATGAVTGGATVEDMGDWWLVRGAPGSPAAGSRVLLFRTDNEPVGNTLIVRDPQVELGSTSTNYQRVGSSFNVTESGQRDCFGVRADGIDDGYETTSIDFTGTNKVTVFAAVRKLSDAAQATVVSNVNTVTTGTGFFWLQAPSGATSNVRWSARELNGGTAQLASATVAANNTFIATGQTNGDTDIHSIRLNGVVAETATGDLGTDNFRAGPLQFLRNNLEPATPFNGDLYALIVAGGSYPLSTIQRVERILSRITPTVNL